MFGVVTEIYMQICLCAHVHVRTCVLELFWYKGGSTPIRMEILIERTYVCILVCV